MQDKDKTKEQLSKELAELRRRLDELKPMENGRWRAERHFRLLSSAVEQSSEGLAVCDPKGDLLFVNRAFAAMHGYTPQELVGKHLSIFHTPEQMPSVEKANRQIKKTGKFSGEIWHARSDGTVFPTLMQNSILRDDTGKTIGLIRTLRDISDIRQVEEQCRENEQRFRDVAENAMEWIWEVDAGGKYIYASPAVKKILGYRPEEVCRKRFYDLFHPDEREKLKESALEFFARKKPFRKFINRNAHKNGKTVWLSTSGVPLIDEKGDLLGYRGADADITERVRAEGELEKYRRRLEKMVEERTAGLTRANVNLRREINRRKVMEKTLRDSDKKLREQKKALEQKNIALGEILERIEADKDKLKDDILNNVNNLALPVVRKLKREGLMRGKKYVDLLERNLKELASSFGRKLLDPRLKFSPREIEICDMIKSGLTSKEISGLLRISIKTVERHRFNIRKKLGIAHKKINLTSYIQSL